MREARYSRSSVLLFLKQEPGTDAEIKAFAKGFNVKFDMFSKVDVNGDNAHPLWQYLKAKTPKVPKE